MDDQRQAKLARKRDVRAKDRLGDFGRGEIVVIVEPALADPDAFRVAREGADRRRVDHGLLGRVVGMRPDGEIDIGISFSDRNKLSTVAHAGRNGHKRSTPAAALERLLASNSSAKS